MRLTKYAVACGFTVILAACGAATQHEKQSASDLGSYPAVWAAWDDPTIPVCWENMDQDEFEQEREWVREKVELEFEGPTPLNFTGWGDCQDEDFDFDGIRIVVADSGPHTKGLGKLLSGKKNGMLLNFTFENWSTSCGLSETRRKRCIRGIGVHEFGHAIGLAHEHNRPDTPDTCDKSPQGTNGTVTVGEYDEMSVMNYCNPVYNNNGNLTDGDIDGINYLYADDEE